MNPAAVPAPAPPIIEMKGVSVARRQDAGPNVGERQAPDERSGALMDIHWTVAAGDYWVVAGLQSSGKTEFLFMTAGLTPPAGGRYRLFGETMPMFEERRLATRLRLGLVFGGGRLFNQLTVWENVALPVRYHRHLGLEETLTVVQPLLEALGLEPWAESTAGTVPRQWQTRAGLARALVLQPEVLLLDEPLAGLDPRQVQWWLEFLGELSQGHRLLGGRPLTLVVTAADLRPWKNRARHFAILKDRFVVLGPREQLEAASAELVRESLMSESVVA